MGQGQVGSGQYQGEGEVIFLWGEIAVAIASEARRNDPNYVPELLPEPTWKSRLGDIAYWSINVLVVALFVVTPILLFLMILFAAFPVEFVQVLRG